MSSSKEDVIVAAQNSYFINTNKGDPEVPVCKLIKPMVGIQAGFKGGLYQGEQDQYILSFAGTETSDFRDPLQDIKLGWNQWDQNRASPDGFYSVSADGWGRAREIWSCEPPLPLISGLWNRPV